MDSHVWYNHVCALLCILVDIGNCEYAVKCVQEWSIMIVLSCVLACTGMIVLFYCVYSCTYGWLHLCPHVCGCMHRMTMHVFVIHVFIRMGWLCMYCHMHVHVYVCVCKVHALSWMSLHIPCDCAYTAICVYLWRGSHSFMVNACFPAAWSFFFAGVEASQCFNHPWHPPLGHRDILCPSCHSSLKMLVLFATFP